MFIGEKYSSSLFKWDGDSKTFLAKYADVPGCLREYSSEDIVSGFMMISSKTKNKAVFELKEIQKSPIGNVFIFKPTERSIVKLPSLDGAVVKVLT